MKTKIIKCISFIVILLLILIILSQIVIPKNNSEEFGMRDIRANGILGEKENTIDVLVVGDSLSFSAIVPMELWEKYGFTSYINGTPGQKITDSYSFVWNAMETQNPKIVILEADNLFRDSTYDEAIEKLINQMLPITEYHDRWKNLNSNDFFEDPNYTWTEDSKGYYYSKDSYASIYGDYMAYSSKYQNIPKCNEFLVKLLKNYCEANGAQFMMISTPSSKNWSYAKHNAAEKFTKENDIEFVDLNLKNDKVKIDWVTDTRDVGDHLNHKGALKVTKFLGEYLKRKNILEDHRNDKEYSKWNEALKRYKENCV